MAMDARLFWHMRRTVGRTKIWWVTGVVGLLLTTFAHAQLTHEDLFRRARQAADARKEGRNPPATTGGGSALGMARTGSSLPVRVADPAAQAGPMSATPTPRAGGITQETLAPPPGATPLRQATVPRAPATPPAEPQRPAQERIIMSPPPGLLGAPSTALPPVTAAPPTAAAPPIVRAPPTPPPSAIQAQPLAPPPGATPATPSKPEPTATAPPTMAPPPERIIMSPPPGFLRLPSTPSAAEPLAPPTVPAPTAVPTDPPAAAKVRPPVATPAPTPTPSPTTAAPARRPQEPATTSLPPTIDTRPKLAAPVTEKPKPAKPPSQPAQVAKPPAEAPSQRADNRPPATAHIPVEAPPPRVQDTPPARVAPTAPVAAQPTTPPADTTLKPDRYIGEDGIEVWRQGYTGTPVNVFPTRGPDTRYKTIPKRTVGIIFVMGRGYSMLNNYTEETHAKFMEALPALDRISWKGLVVYPSTVDVGDVRSYRHAMNIMPLYTWDGTYVRKNVQKVTTNLLNGEPRPPSESSIDFRNDKSQLADLLVPVIPREYWKRVNAHPINSNGNGETVPRSHKEQETIAFEDFPSESRRQFFDALNESVGITHLARAVSVEHIFDLSTKMREARRGSVLPEGESYNPTPTSDLLNNFRSDVHTVVYVFFTDRDIITTNVDKAKLDLLDAHLNPQTELGYIMPRKFFTIGTDPYDQNGCKQKELEEQQRITMDPPLRIPITRNTTIQKKYPPGAQLPPGTQALIVPPYRGARESDLPVMSGVLWDYSRRGFNLQLGERLAELPSSRDRGAQTRPNKGFISICSDSYKPLFEEIANYGATPSAVLPEVPVPEPAPAQPARRGGRPPAQQRVVPMSNAPATTPPRGVPGGRSAETPPVSRPQG